MKAWKTWLAGIGLALGLSGLMFAAATATQTVTMQIASISVLATTGNPATLAVSAPGTAGAIPANPTDSTTYARYTSTVAAGVTRRLQANWGASDAGPAGCTLLLTATPGSGQGTGAPQITMSSTAQNIVTAIGSCATGTAVGNGALLAYTLSINSMTALVAGDNHTVTITITLTDN
jgi:hypothetical protein